MLHAGISESAYTRLLIGSGQKVQMPERTEGELREALSEQIKALKSSCKAYDKGETWEAKRLATSIYILVHDGGRNSRSLLGQLGLKENTSFISSIYDDEQPDWLPRGYGKPMSFGLSPMLGFKILPANSGVEHDPMLGREADKYENLSFKKWYRQNVLNEASPLRLTRKNIIHVMRSQDGGAHVDSRIEDATYLQAEKYGDGITTFNKGLQITVGKPPEGDPLKGGARAIMLSLIHI